MQTFANLIATVAKVGYLKPASGTWGSAVAVGLFWVLQETGGPVLVTIGILAAYFGGLWATKIVTEATGNHDPSEIVIDEVAGQWVALLPVSIGATMMGVSSSALWPGYVTAFVAFRIFDIWKPWIVGWADRRGDPTGVMLDDIFAGLFAAVVVIILAALSHGVMMR